MSNETCPLGSQFSKNRANSPPVKPSIMSVRAEWNPRTWFWRSFVFFPATCPIVISVSAWLDCSPHAPCKAKHFWSKIPLCNDSYEVRLWSPICSCLFCPYWPVLLREFQSAFWWRVCLKCDSAITHNNMPVHLPHSCQVVHLPASIGIWARGQQIPCKYSSDAAHFSSNNVCLAGLAEQS